MGNNNLSELRADNIKHLHSLSVLDLRDNKITNIPEEITLLESLERLDITNNDVSTLVVFVC